MRIFFSYYRDGDGERAAVLRQRCLSFPGTEVTGCLDALAWERAKREGPIKDWIDGQLEGTSVTLVLLGSETSYIDYVKYEIKKSYGRKNSLLGIFIHDIPDDAGATSEKGLNPFEDIFITKDGATVTFAEIYPTYDWVADDGEKNLGEWIQKTVAD